MTRGNKIQESKRAMAMFVLELPSPRTKVASTMADRSEELRSVFLTNLLVLLVPSLVGVHSSRFRFITDL